MLQHLIEELQRGPLPTNAVQGDKAVRSRIVELKDQINELSKMKDILVKYVESAVELILNRKESEINAFCQPAINNLTVLSQRGAFTNQKVHPLE
jgi:hypothetical protein